MAVWEGNKLPALVMPVCCYHVQKMHRFNVCLSPALCIAHAEWAQATDPSHELAVMSEVTVSQVLAETAEFAVL